MASRKSAWLGLSALGAVLVAALGLGRPEADGAAPVAPLQRREPSEATVPPPVTDSPHEASREMNALPTLPALAQAVWRDTDEEEVMRFLRELSAEDAALTVQLARLAEARFPRSSRAAERGYFEVRALVNLGQLDEAVVRARALVAAHPEDPFTNDVARHLLTHPMTHATEVRQQ